MLGVAAVLVVVRRALYRKYRLPLKAVMFAGDVVKKVAAVPSGPTKLKGPNWLLLAATWNRSVVFAGRLLKPIQVIAEATGTLSLLAAIISQRDQLLAAVGGPLLAMFILFEVSFLLGLAVGGPTRASRFVIATGTGNRNIALALLISVQSFPASRITGYVVADGLTLIFLGLIHVGLWRLFVRNQPPTTLAAN